MLGSLLENEGNGLRSGDGEVGGSLPALPHEKRGGAPTKRETPSSKVVGGKEGNLKEGCNRAKRLGRESVINPIGPI